MLSFSSLSLQDYCNALAEKKSVPGGGSALAVVLELAISLNLMVIRFTLQKPGYEQVSTAMEKCQTIALSDQQIAHQAIDEDALAFQAIMDAYRLKDENVLHTASLRGVEVPFIVGQCAKRTKRIAQFLLDNGNMNLRSDAEIAFQLCEAILPGCEKNMQANMSALTEQERQYYTVEWEKPIDEIL